VIPVVPAPAVTVPQNVIPAIPRGSVPPATPVIPPPPTLPQGSRTFGVPGATPADLQPRIVPGPIGTPLPASPAPGSGTFTPLSPGGFQAAPTTPPSTGFGTGGFGSGTNYAPAVDPYSSSRPVTPVAPDNVAPSNKNAGPSHSVFGSGYRGGSRSDAAAGDSGVIRAPELGPAMPPSVQTVPDLDAPAPPRPTNSAPQLINPRDKTAGVGNRWAVVPAKWPEKQSATRQLSDRPVSPTKGHTSPYATSQPAAPKYDDSGWKTGAF
jgi:hypothetical protein